jgi:hypothetical protein
VTGLPALVKTPLKFTNGGTEDEAEPLLAL